MLPRSRITGFLVNTSGLRKWLLQGHTVKAGDCLGLPALSLFFHFVMILPECPMTISSTECL